MGAVAVSGGIWEIVSERASGQVAVRFPLENSPGDSGLGYTGLA